MKIAIDVTLYSEDVRGIGPNANTITMRTADDNRFSISYDLLDQLNAVMEEERKLGHARVKWHPII